MKHKRSKWNGKQPTYRQRDETLKVIGFASYKDYLASDLWKFIKSSCLVTAGGICRLCHTVAITAHHIGYGKETLLGLKPIALVPVCNSCHYAIEFDWSGTKRTLKESERAYRKMWRVCPWRKRRSEPR